MATGGRGAGNPDAAGARGIVLSVVLIQFLMRQCFVFANLLLAPRLPEPIWLRSLLLAEEDGPRALYFNGLVAGCAAAAGLCWAARARAPQTPRARSHGGARGPRRDSVPPAAGQLRRPDHRQGAPAVADLGGVEALREGQEAWLVWEGKDGVTYLVRGPEGRRLVTLPQREVKRTQIIGYDAILRRIFLEDGDQTTEIDYGSDPLFCGFDPRPQPLAVRPRAGADEATEEADFLGAAARSHGHLRPRRALRKGRGRISQARFGSPTSSAAPLRAAGDARGGSRSPVFLHGDDLLLAISGDEIVRVPAAGGEPRQRLPRGRVVKLIGYDPDRPDEILVLGEGADGARRSRSSRCRRGG